ncbi:hypothetical protein K450DRAFT_225333 [Umbelopsis ramanniana AG]|uniref:Uncharacterized protein n=1 Tax=Umbelopsis ramanniana AG TaxID=1314678 RepID=A0AAD5EG54_UMBRA|nr:uncharacterized protein K450DRAFT_225333 [Umbelopsis ramanniana AG]KAI8582894.1 hypothetical protein K450DRAFT_225333 [Umbelopsis ramanniana AG]
MGGSSPQIFGVLAALFAVLLLVFTNIGTTFTSTFLPKLFLVEASSSSTGKSIRYGVYNSCLFQGDSLQSCTKAAIGYSYDLSQLGEAFNVTTLPFSIPSTQAKLHQAAGILIFLAAILAFVSLLGGAAIRHWQRHNFPRAIGAASALAALVAACIGIALTIYSYWTSFAIAQQVISDLSFKWGPSIGTLAASAFCLIITTIGYIASCFSRHSKSRDSYQLYDYEFGHGNDHYY